MVTMTINGLIHLDHCPENVKRQIKQALSIENPLFKRLVRMGNTRALYACPKEFHYYTEDKKSGRLSMGRGMFDRVQTHLAKCGFKTIVVDRRGGDSFDRTDYPAIEL